MPVYRSELQTLKGAALDWARIEILTTTLTRQGNKDTNFYIQVFQFRKSGNHKLLGGAAISVTKLMEMAEARQDILLRGNKGEMSGQLAIAHIQVE